MSVATLPLIHKELTAFAPASVGNVIAGFDVLGLAVRPTQGEPWGDSVAARLIDGPGPTLTVEGPFAAALPPDPGDNLVLRCHEIFASAMVAAGRPMPAVALTLRKGLPLCSGLGSSSASVVATLFVLNELCKKPFDHKALLAMAGEGEGVFSGAPHLDNVAPCLLGGLQLVDPFGGSAPVPWPRGWRLALVHPNLKVSTQAARQALPQGIPLTSAVGYWQNLAALVGALHRGDDSLAARCLRDSIVEAYRGPLVRGFEPARRAALAAGAFAFSLSGSGPSVLAVCNDDVVAEAAASAIVNAFEAEGIASQGGVFEADAVGARLSPAT